LQSVGLPTPQYAIVESIGPDHRRVFQVELRVNGRCLTTGEGTTIKGAHQAAARAALDILETEIENLKETAPSVEEPSIASPAIETEAKAPITDGIF
jgi:ribonuclease-3